MTPAPLGDRHGALWFGAVSALRIHGWGEESDVVFCGWTRETHQLEAGAAELLRWLIGADVQPGCRLEDAQAAFAGLMAPGEVEQLLSELVRLGLVWQSNDATQDPVLPGR